MIKREVQKKFTVQWAEDEENNSSKTMGCICRRYNIIASWRMTPDILRALAKVM